MSQIRIKNFGPIKSGLEENKFLDIKKVTVFIGNQATGKSSIAKLISTLSWIEKALYRGDIKNSDVTSYNRFVKIYCGYQNIKNYFSTNTEIEFIGKIYRFLYIDGKFNIALIHDFSGNNIPYLVPKIMYVPAERNFLSAVDRPGKLKNLPKTLYTFLEEFEKALQSLKEGVSLPLNNIRFEYQKLNKISYIIGANYKIRLSEASSGLQSFVPLFLVSRNLAKSIGKPGDTSKNELSIEEQKRLKNEIEKVLFNDKLTEELKSAALEVLSSKHTNSCFINIVEEVEQNLFPKSQKDLLFKLLEFVNYLPANELILTTHSPYVINYLSLSIKAFNILQNFKNDSSQLLNDLKIIVPIEACVDPKDTVIYEMTEDGKIIKLPDYKGIPSDENYLNQFLADTNNLFDDLLEIEEKL